MKEEVTSKTKKKISTETENYSSNGGGKKRLSPFRSWLKRTIQGIRFRTSKSVNAVFHALLVTIKIVLKKTIVIALKNYVRNKNRCHF